MLQAGRMHRMFVPAARRSVRLRAHSERHHEDLLHMGGGRWCKWPNKREKHLPSSRESRSEGSSRDPPRSPQKGPHEKQTKKKQLETTVNHGKSKASSEGTNAIRSLFPFRLLPMCRRLSQPVNGLEDWRREDIQVHASFLHWRLQAWGSDEVLPLNQVQSFHYYPGLDTDLWTKTVCNSL